MDEFTDIAIRFTVVSLALGITMFLHFRLYNRQQKELETAFRLAASEAKSRFLAHMSHEIRTPISIMLGMNEVILRDSGEAQADPAATADPGNWDYDPWSDPGDGDDEWSDPGDNW